MLRDYARRIVGSWANRVDAAADALAHPPIAVRGPHTLITGHDLFGEIDHLLRTQSGLRAQTSSDRISRCGP